jgi:MscS family membrane protein
MRLRPRLAALQLAGGSACPTAIVCLLLWLCGGAYAAGQDPLNRDSPQSSATAFLAACQAQDYQRAWRYMDLRKLPAGQRLKDGTQLAKQLQQILDRDAQFDLAALSGNPEGDPPGTNRERVDSFSVDGRPLALELERVTVGSGAKIWVFSSASVDLIPRIARLASDSPIEKYLPEPLVSWKLIDTSLWRWIALLLLAAALAALSMLASRLALLWMQPALKRVVPRMNTDLLEVLLGPLRLLLAVLGFRAGLEWIDPSPALRLYLERGAGLLFFLALAWLGMRITDLLIVRLRGALGGKHRTFSYSVLPLASRVVKIVIVAVTAAALLSSWGYNTGAILAGLGVGGIALALAAQKTIENLFGGVAVITDRPVTIGDFCRVGDKVGTVEDIGLRSTRIRTLDRTLLTVPNGQFSSMTLENFSQRDKMWFHLMLNLRRDTTSGQVRTLLESITKALQQNPKVETGPIPVRFVGVGTYSLDVEIFAYVLTRDGDEFTRIQQELFLWILDAVEAAGTALAVPTQAYYSMARTPHQNGAPVPQETRA